MAQLAVHAMRGDARSGTVPAWMFCAIPVVAFAAVQVYLASNVSSLEYDEAIFLNVAGNLRDGNGLLRSLSGGVYYLEHTPLYPLLLAGVSTVFGTSVAMLRSLTTLAGLAGVIIVFSAVTRRAGAWAGLIAALLVALNPMWTVFSHIIYMEVFMATALVAAAYFLGRDELSIRDWWYAGAAVAVAVMFKELALIFLGVAVLYALLLPGRWPSRLARTVAVGGPVTIALLVWLLWANHVAPDRLRDVLGRWSGSVSGGVGSVRTGVSQSEWGGVLAVTVIGLGLLVLLGVGLILLATRPERRTSWAILLGGYVFASVAASFVVSLKEPRHLIAVVPMAAMFVGVAVDWDGFIRSAAANRMRLLSGVAIAAAITALVIPVRLGWAAGDEPIAWSHTEWETRLSTEPAVYSDYPAVGEFLNRTMDASEAVAVFRAGPVVAYYAERDYSLLYYSDLHGILSSIEQAQYVVQDGSTLLQLGRDETLALVSKLQREFTIAARFGDDSREILVYERRS